MLYFVPLEGLVQHRVSIQVLYRSDTDTLDLNKYPHLIDGNRDFLRDNEKNLPQIRICNPASKERCLYLCINAGKSELQPVDNFSVRIINSSFNELSSTIQSITISKHCKSLTDCCNCN